MSNMISNIAQLAIEVGVDPVMSFEDFYSGRLARRIGKALYKGTECGIAFEYGNAGVRVAGFAEGSQGDCPWYDLYYPFSTAEFWDAVECANIDGNLAWDEANAGVDEVQEMIDADNKQRAADMDATLKDIGGGL